jgi:hypothetical protein|tara:strand:- start:639 stop:965 length:327 start_codon:yes stop_codon:yes gene_type:complete
MVGFKESYRNAQIKSGAIDPFEDIMLPPPPQKTPDLMPDLMQREMSDIGVVGPTLPPQVRLAMFNAGQPDHKKVTLYGSGMSMTRQMDKWDVMGVPYGGGGGFVNPVC